MLVRLNCFGNRWNFILGDGIKKFNLYEGRVWKAGLPARHPKRSPKLVEWNCFGLTACRFPPQNALRCYRIWATFGFWNLLSSRADKSAFQLEPAPPAFKTRLSFRHNSIIPSPKMKFHLCQNSSTQLTWWSGWGGGTQPLAAAIACPAYRR